MDEIHLEELAKDGTVERKNFNPILPNPQKSTILIQPAPKSLDNFFLKKSAIDFVPRVKAPTDGTKHPEVRELIEESDSVNISVNDQEERKMTSSRI